MASKKAALRQRLAELLDALLPADAVIDDAEARRLRAALGEVSDRMWRDLLRDCGRPLAPLVEGVRQDTPADLERTLLGLWQTWMTGDRETRDRARRLVIEAKDHAKWAANNPKVDPDKRAARQEMALWMLTWLENPDVFEPWVALRKAHLAEAAAFPYGNSSID